MSSSKDIKIGALLSGTTTGLSLVLSLDYMVWMIDAIGQAHYGLNSLASSFFTVSRYNILWMVCGIVCAVLLAERSNIEECSKVRFLVSKRMNAR